MKSHSRIERCNTNKYSKKCVLDKSDKRIERYNTNKYSTKCVLDKSDKRSNRGMQTNKYGINSC